MFQISGTCARTVNSFLINPNMHNGQTGVSSLQTTRQHASLPTSNAITLHVRGQTNGKTGNVRKPYSRCKKATPVSSREAEGKGALMKSPRPGGHGFRRIRGRPLAARSTQTNQLSDQKARRHREVSRRPRYAITVQSAKQVLSAFF